MTRTDVLLKLLLKHKIFFCPFMQKDKSMLDFSSSKKLCMRVQEGENDFIFIHLFRAPSSDTSNRALSIRYGLVLIHCPGLSLIPTFASWLAKCGSRWTQLELEGSPGGLKYVGCLSAIACPAMSSYFLPWFAVFLSPPPKNTTSPPSSCGNDCQVMAFKTPNCLKYKGCCKPHLQQGIFFPLFGLDVQWSNRQQFNHY